MQRLHIAVAVTVALLAAGLAGCGKAPQGPAPQAREITRENSQAFGEYIVHCNAQSTTRLSPEVARAFGIRRSGNRAMLNVAVLRQAAGQVGAAVPAVVTVGASNLLGQDKAVRMRELREGEAIYYIGELSIANEEIVNFDIGVQPEGVTTPYRIRFQQQFYTD